MKTTGEKVTGFNQLEIGRKTHLVVFLPLLCVVFDHYDLTKGKLITNNKQEMMSMAAIS